MIDPDQVEEVGRIYSRVWTLLVLNQLLAASAVGLVAGVVVFLLLGGSFGAYSLASAAVIALFAAKVMHILFSKPLLTISALSSYETDKGLEDCWEETRSMDGYAVRNFGRVEVIDRKDDELVFEVAYPRFMSHAAKRTIRCRRSEEKRLESMRVDLFVDGVFVGRDLIGVGRLGNKTVVEYETVYSTKQTLSEYFLYQLIGRYTPKIAKVLGYRKRKSQRNISFR
jgi:hypothetical protein